MIIFLSYLASAAAFYFFVSRVAPVEPESRLMMATKMEPCQVIEIFKNDAEEATPLAA